MLRTRGNGEPASVRFAGDVDLNGKCPVGVGPVSHLALPVFSHGPEGAVGPEHQGVALAGGDARKYQLTRLSRVELDRVERGRRPVPGNITEPGKHGLCPVT